MTGPNPIQNDDYANNLNELLNQVRRGNNDQINLNDNYIHSFEFEKQFSFFNWSSKYYPYEIMRLMRGELATFYADIKQAKFDAVKFCTLYILIEIAGDDNERSEELTDLLKKFYVELTYAGDSNYKFGEKFYVIDSSLNNYKEESLKLISQYGCRRSEKCQNMNESFKKLTASKPMMSPYTYWNIRIYPIDSTSSSLTASLLTSIQSLFSKTIEEQVELIVSLNGLGQYVSQDIKKKKFIDLNC